MLTEAQVAKARTFPGCGDLSADNAVDKLFLTAERLQTSASSALSENETLTAENKRVAARVTRLEGELATAQTIAKQPDPAVLKAMSKSTRIHLRSAIEKQAISTATGELLANALIGTNLDKDEEKLSAVGLIPDASGECMASMVFSALASGGPAPLVGKDANGQPVPKTQHGAPEGESELDKGLKAGKAHQERLLAARGLK